MIASRKNSTWTKSEISYIRNNFPIKSDQEIASHLNRTVHGVCQRRLKMRMLITSETRYPQWLHARKIQRLKCAVVFSKVLNRMKVLVFLCENELNSYRKDKYKEELKRLGELTIIRKIKNQKLI